MKIVVASDLHGSAYYARKVAERFAAEEAQLLILLGDIYNHGPRNPLPTDYAPMQVAEILNALSDRLIAIKGNCDSEVDQMISEFALTPLAQVFADGYKITCTHGHEWNIDRLPPNAGDMLLYGHFHVNWIRRVGSLVVANPGSAALPKDGTPHGYLTIDAGTLALKDLETGETLETVSISA